MRVVIVGTGPRGLIVFERLCANSARDQPGPTVYLVDSTSVGTGAVWRTEQPHDLLMNTIASQVSVFADDSVSMRGPVAHGPTMYDWARNMDSETRSSLPGVLRLQSSTLTENSYASRALYGYYLDWSLALVRERNPHVQAVDIRATAVDVRDEPDGTQTVVFSEADTTDAVEGLDAVILTQGHLPTADVVDAPVAVDVVTGNNALYYPPGNAADASLDRIGSGDHVMIRGLGLTFFDYMTLLTLGRGGRFENNGESLTYIPSGREPRLYAGSRRGVPHRARGDNQKGIAGRHIPFLLDSERIVHWRTRAASGGDVDFRRDIWPTVAAEVEIVYYCALLSTRGRNDAIPRFKDRYALTGSLPGHRREVLDEFGISQTDTWDWERIQHPAGSESFSDPTVFNEWVLSYLDDDVENARLGNVRGPVAAALDVLRDLRNEVRLVLDHSGISGLSYREHVVNWYTPMNAFLSIGPPSHKSAEMAALIRANVLTLVGPGTEVTIDPSTGNFLARSNRVGRSEVTTPILIDARQPEPDVRRTGDHLSRTLLARGDTRPYVVRDSADQHYETGGIEVTEDSHRLVRRDGTVHPRRYAFGVPTEYVRWVTAAGPRPGVDSVTFSDADHIANSVIEQYAHTALPESV